MACNSQEIRIKRQKSESSDNKPTIDEKTKYSANMTSEFKSMVNNPEFSDFTFTVNGVIYFAHKCVLSSRSPVFAAMFRSNMSETQTNNMVFYCDSDVFEELLHYLYTGELSKGKQFARQLLIIADKYEIMSLKTVCEDSIEIENTNAIEVLIMADSYNCDQLKKRAIDHILDNLQEIRTTFEFREFLADYPSLVNEIFASIDFVRKDFDRIFKCVCFDDDDSGYFVS